jgi:glycosyltransferase involved in cell wall biosynthesis
VEPILYFVIPCYNEEQVLPETAGLFLGKLNAMIEAGKISPDSRVMFVNDGSRDKTWEIISGLTEEDEHYAGISLSHNRGHQNALHCALMTLRDRADCVISMDADLQDDIDAIDAMLGTTVHIDGILADEHVDVEIPAGCQHGQQICRRSENDGTEAAKTGQ